MEVDDKIIIKSMKKVFREELDEMEQELRKLYDKYNVKSSKELEFKISEGFVHGEDVRLDLDSMKELEENLEKIRSYLRDINMKSL
jgi:exonuclease I